MWNIAYVHPDGKRRTESSKSERRGDAERLLRKRLGAKEHNLPVIPRAEQLTFARASQAVINDFEANKKKSLKVVRRRIDKHLMPFFGLRRMAGITTSDVLAYVAKRQTDFIVVRKARTENDVLLPEVHKPVSAAEVNRELQVLKRIFCLAIESGIIGTKPKIKMLREAPPRAGFFERAQYEAVLGHLPVEVQPVITFAYFTGWRINSEILGLQWRQVDFDAGEIRLDAGTTKNGEGRVFPMTAELRTLLKARLAAHEDLAKAGTIEPLVFFRMVAEKRRGEKKPRRILAFTKAWKEACRQSGCPGRIPHDLRRTAVRNMVRAGIPERVAMMLTGHKTRSVFERYNITSPTDLLDAASRLNVHATGR